MWPWLDHQFRPLLEEPCQVWNAINLLLVTAPRQTIKNAQLTIMGWHLQGVWVCVCFWRSSWAVPPAFTWMRLFYSYNQRNASVFVFYLYTSANCIIFIQWWEKYIWDPKTHHSNQNNVKNFQSLLLVNKTATVAPGCGDACREVPVESCLWWRFTALCPPPLLLLPVFPLLQQPDNGGNRAGGYWCGGGV